MSRSDSPHSGADLPNAALTREALRRVLAEHVEAEIVTRGMTYRVVEIRDNWGFFSYHGSYQGGRVAYEWHKEEYARLHPAVQAARALLEDWFHAIETGTARYRMPDPKYPTAIDTATCDRIIAHLTEQFAHEIRAWAGLEVAGGYDAGPGFDRLAGPQRLALCQALHRIKREHFPAEAQD